MPSLVFVQVVSSGDFNSGCPYFRKIKYGTKQLFYLYYFIANVNASQNMSNVMFSSIKFLDLKFNVIVPRKTSVRENTIIF